eukprot:m.97977 g.97977  ORF g.97977 m.97977 type:complete len:382 (+) comp8841_c0_seq3:3301-4446(+)
MRWCTRSCSTAGTWTPTSARRSRSFRRALPTSSALRMRSTRRWDRLRTTSRFTPRWTRTARQGCARHPIRCAGPPSLCTDLALSARGFQAWQSTRTRTRLPCQARVAKTPTRRLFPEPIRTILLHQDTKCMRRLCLAHPSMRWPALAAAAPTTLSPRRWTCVATLCLSAQHTTRLSRMVKLSTTTSLRPAALVCRWIRLTNLPAAASQRPSSRLSRPMSLPAAAKHRPTGSKFLCSHRMSWLVRARPSCRSRSCVPHPTSGPRTRRSKLARRVLLLQPTVCLELLLRSPSSKTHTTICRSSLAMWTCKSFCFSLLLSFFLFPLADVWFGRYASVFSTVFFSIAPFSPFPSGREVKSASVTTSQQGRHRRFLVLLSDRFPCH